jgi:hypothetical protein
MTEQLVSMTPDAPIRTPDAMASPHSTRPPHTGTLRHQRCLRCEHRWWPRSPMRTLRCPGCKSPYWDRPRRTVQDGKKSPRREAGATVAEPRKQAIGTGESLSFAMAMELLRRLKAEGRSWTELRHELHQQCGVQLDKDQLKALIR